MNIDKGDADRVAILFERLEGRIGALEKETKYLMSNLKTLQELQIELGKLQMQIKVTWGLLIMVVGGLLSVAFSLLK
jgi:hypothetical protein